MLFLSVVHSGADGYAKSEWTREAESSFIAEAAARKTNSAHSNEQQHHTAIDANDMAIPDFQSIMRPLLAAHSDGKEHSNRDLVNVMAEHFTLTEQERREMLPSGSSRLFDNRVGWAKTHMTRAGLLDSPRRAYTLVTPRGEQVLKNNPTRVDMGVLEQFEDYREFRGRRRQDGPSDEPVRNGPPETPYESLEAAYVRIRREVEALLLKQILESPPDVLERVVVDLIVRMGYGGSRKDAGAAIGRSRDEGIDGIIKEDQLGLDAIYLQAKRWENTVGRPEIQKFAGALQGQRAKKGIFITTSTFSADALDYASRIDSKIILIDGARLAQLMFDHGVGVSTSSVYEVKRIDSDYFTDQ